MKNIITEIENRIAILTINRPESLNALNKEVIEELSEIFIALESDENVRVMLLTGKGEKAFVAGADIKEFQHYSGKEGENLARKGQEILFNRIENLSKPVIALLNGYCLGGGLELAMACHFRIASSNAKLGLPEVTLGLIPGYGGTQRLPKLVGKGRANQMIFTAEMINAEKAANWGLVNEVVEQDELLQRGKEIANKISANSSFAITKAIKATNNYDTSYGFETEIQSFGELFDQKDFKEGVTAFLEKRKPKF